MSQKAWDERLLYKVLERRPRSQCVVVMARERLHAKRHVLNVPVKLSVYEVE